MKETSSKKTASFFARNQNILLTTGVVLLVAGAGFYIYKRKKEKSSEVLGMGTLIKESASIKRFRCTNKKYPLTFGTCHPDVKVLQKYLKLRKQYLGTAGNKRDGVDGRFGALTQKAAKDTLKKQQFTQSDIKGMQTALKMLSV